MTEAELRRQAVLLALVVSRGHAVADVIRRTAAPVRTIVQDVQGKG